MATALTLKTLTIAETLNVLRNTYGMKISQPTLEAGIRQGVYPFGVCIELDRCVYQIFESMLYRWISERCIEEIIPELPKEEEE